MGQRCSYEMFSAIIRMDGNGFDENETVILSCVQCVNTKDLVSFTNLGELIR